MSYTLQSLEAIKKENILIINKCDSAKQTYAF